MCPNSYFNLYSLWEKYWLNILYSFFTFEVFGLWCVFDICSSSHCGISLLVLSNHMELITIVASDSAALDLLRTHGPLQILLLLLQGFSLFVTL